MKKRWTENRSLAFTRWCTRIVLALCIVFGAAASPLWQWFLTSLRPELTALLRLFLISSYLLLVPAIAALLLLLRLLRNLADGTVFVPENVVLLRGISWLCAIACGICAASALYYPVFLLFAGAFGLMALLLNAVKNCFGQAVAMQDELDLTV